MEAKNEQWRELWVSLEGWRRFDFASDLVGVALPIQRFLVPLLSLSLIATNCISLARYSLMIYLRLMRHQSSASHVFFFLCLRRIILGYLHHFFMLRKACTSELLDPCNDTRTRLKLIILSGRGIREKKRKGCVGQF